MAGLEPLPLNPKGLENEMETTKGFIRMVEGLYIGIMENGNCYLGFRALARGFRA